MAETTTAPPPREGLPPGPRMPKALQDVALVTRLRPFLRSCQQRYGDIFTVRVHGFGNIVVLGDPALIKRTFTASPVTLLSGEGSPLGPILGYNSLLVTDGAVHLRHRKLLLPPFHGQRMQGYDSLIESITREEIASWPLDREFPVAPSTMRITLRAILTAVFGARGDQLQRLEEVLPPMTELGSAVALTPQIHYDLGPLSPWGRFTRMRATVDAICDELIEEARRDPQLAERPDVLALLVQARYDDGAPMRDVEIRDQLLTMLAAGHETTAAQLAWIVELLRRHPATLEQLVAEADAGGRELRDATIREVQRLRPVIMFTTRTVNEPFELGGFVLPPGTRIALPGALTHYDERLFADPFAFKPERFLGRKPDTYGWLPFGGGIRRCIGAAFAHMEMDVVLRTILQTYTLSPTTAPQERMKFRGVAHTPARGGLARISKRVAPPPPPAEPVADERVEVAA